jgi:transposase
MDAAQIAAIADAEVLRALLLEKVAAIAQRDEALAERDALIAKRERTIQQRDSHIEALTFEIARLRRLQFAARSERMDATQRSLFDETVAADIAAAEAQLDALKRASTLPAAPRQTPKRQPLPAELPRVTTVHEPACTGCAQCGGELVRIGEHVRERLACKPIEFFVRREVFPQYACRPCERIVAEPVPPAILDRSQADASLLAQVTIAKYLDHLPLYRQEDIYARSGADLSRSTLAEWIGAVGVALQPLVDALRRELLACPVLHADETPVEQLDPGAGKTKRAYLFAYRSAVGLPVVVFDYCPSRSGEHARRFLGEWRGALMVDDYVGYKASFANPGLIELGCWAHERRPWIGLLPGDCPFDWIPWRKAAIDALVAYHHGSGIGATLVSVGRWVAATTRVVFSFGRNPYGHPQRQNYSHSRLQALETPSCRTAGMTHHEVLAD